MAVYNIIDSTIYQYYKISADFMRENRTSNNNICLNHSLNLSIVLSMACYVEGVLESKGKLLLGYHRTIYKLINKTNKSILEIRRPMNTFYRRIEEEVSKKVSQCTGLDSYNSIFELLIGKSMKEDKMVKPYIEAISVLFQFRNVIAHGRQIHAYKFSSYETNNEFEENFFGGYKKAEMFLMKKGLLSNKYVECGMANLFFTNEIADYFYETSLEFLNTLDLFIEDNIEIGDAISNEVKSYNEKQNTDYSAMEYFQMRGCIP